MSFSRPLILALGLVAAALPASALAAISSPFPDVSLTHPNVDAIVFLQARGYVSGYPDGTFHPDATINRAEFTKILLQGPFHPQAVDHCEQERNNGNIWYFNDVRGSDWFGWAVCEAKERGLVGGYPDGSFRPSASITFAEAAKIIAAGYAGSMQSPDAWYRPYVEYLAGKYAVPTSIRRFDQPITRGEMAEMVARLQERQEDERAGRPYTPKPTTTYETIVKGAITGAVDSGWLTYDDPQGLYHIRYPRDWTANARNGELTIRMPLDAISLERVYLNNAFIRITTPQQCPSLLPSAGSVVQTVTFGGRAFVAVESGEGAAGTQYDTITFTSVMSPSRCLVIEKDIGVSSIMISDGGGDAQEAERQKGMAADAMKEVIKSITFPQ